MTDYNWGFSDNLNLTVNKFVKYQNDNVIGVTGDLDLLIGAPGTIGNIYIGSSNPSTFIDSDTTLVTSKLGVGISNTTLTANITLPINGYLGINSTSSGFIGIGAGNTLDSTFGANAVLYSNVTGANAGSVHLFAGNVTTGSMNFYTGNLKTFEIQTNGNALFNPGNVNVVSITKTQTVFNNDLVLTSTSQSTSPQTGALQVAGGIGIDGNAFINGTLSINDLSGNINFNNTRISDSYSTGTLFISGGLGITTTAIAFSETSGGALSVAGGLALGRNAIIGGAVQILDTTASISSQTGALRVSGGIGANGSINVKSNTPTQLVLVPLNNNEKTGIFLGIESNSGTTGSWTVQNTSGKLALISGTTSTIEFSSTSSNFSTDININSGTLILNNFSIRETNSNLLLGTNVLVSSRGSVILSATENSSSVTQGGALTVAGGGAFGGDLYIDGSIYSSTINTPGTIQGGASQFDFLTITGTELSDNLTSGSIVTFGGITIQASQQNSFLTAGGMTVMKNLNVLGNISAVSVTNETAVITNATIGSVLSNNTVITHGTIQNVIANFISSSNLIATNITSVNVNANSISTGSLHTTNVSSISGTISNLISTGISASNFISTNITTTNLISTNVSTVSLFVGTSLILNGTLGALITTNGNVGINTTSPSERLDVSGTINASKIRINTTESSSGINVGAISGSYMTLAGLGKINTISDTLLVTDYNNLTALSINVTNKSIGINTTTPSSFSLDVSGSIRAISGLPSIQNTTNALSTTSGTMYLGGQIVTDDTLFFKNGTLAAPSASSRSLGSRIVLHNAIGDPDYDTSIGVNTNELWQSVSGSFKWYQNGVNTLTLNSSGNANFVSGATMENLTIRVTSGTALSVPGNIFAERISTGTLLATQVTLGNTNVNGNILANTIGIQCTAPSTILEVSPVSFAALVNSGIRVSTKDPISTSDSSYRFVDLRLASDNSSNFRGAIYATRSGGTATEMEYMAFSQDGTTDFKTPVEFFDTTVSTNSSSASIIINGGVSINCGEPATNSLNGGSLTVNGGAAVSGDLIVGGNILGAAEASSTFAYLTLTATDLASTASDGALVVFGGVSIQAASPATSSTSGNGLNVTGGVAIGQNLIVGTNIHTPNVTATNGSISNLITSSFQSTVSNTIGNLFTSSLGNIGINVTDPSSSLEVSGTIKTTTLDTSSIIGTAIFTNTTVSSNSSTGSLVVLGGASFNATENASSVTQGGALTISGGSSIAKDLFVGGVITSSSDRNLKKNIKPLESILDKISNIHPVTYNNLYNDTTKFLGFIAQDFEEHFPELIRRENLDACYSLAYDRITAVNFKCIKELKEIIDKLQEEIRKLKEFKNNSVK